MTGSKIYTRDRLEGNLKPAASGWVSLTGISGLPSSKPDGSFEWQIVSAEEKERKQVLSTEESSVEEIVGSSSKWLLWLEAVFHGVWWHTDTRWWQRTCQTARSRQWYSPVNSLHTEVKLRSWRENTTSPAVSSQNPREEEKELCIALLHTWTLPLEHWLVRRRAREKNG